MWHAVYYLHIKLKHALQHTIAAAVGLVYFLLRKLIEFNEALTNRLPVMVKPVGL